MAIPTSPATPEQMQIESIQELDRMRMMSIQSLAMQRIRDSVVTLSRETGFRERPVEQFSQAPLFIPQYRQWSNTLGRLVGTPEPTRPKRPAGMSPSSSRQYESFMKQVEDATAVLRGETVMRPDRYVVGRNRTVFTPGGQLTYEQARSELRGGHARPWLNWLDQYSNWLQAQRNLPT